MGAWSVATFSSSAFVVVEVIVKFEERIRAGVEVA